MEKNGRKQLQKAILFLGLLILLAVLAYTGIWKCPMDYIFGIPCPLCGLTRAYSALLHLGFAEAFYYHPLWPIAVPALVLFILYQRKIITLSSKAFDICCIILAVLIVGTFVIRHILGSPVVKIHFETSLLERLVYN